MENMSVEYDRFGRMKYNSELHFNQGKPWTSEELDYLINWLDKTGYEEMSLALGRTEMTVADRVHKLKKKGLMPVKTGPMYHPRLLRRTEDVQTIIA